MASNGALDARDRGGPGRRVPRPAGGPGGGARPGLGYLQPVQQAHPRRAAVPGAVRLQARLRGAAGTRPAGVQARPAPGQAGLVHVPAVQEGGRAPLRRGGPGPVRLDGGHPQAGAAAPAPDRPAGAMLYYDAQVDDARHTLTVARTAAAHSAVVATRVSAVGLLRGPDGTRVTGARVRDEESGREVTVTAEAVVI